ncbi:MAG TPA: hypothetical protein VK427_25105, partial [Kofleriaceae bacterium]|nr:hypothetical protein [Kofleriaceae bacterium]
DSTMVGTRGYMSPEQIADPNAVDFRSDIFSLGVTLREAATGESPSPKRRRAVASMPRELAPLISWMVADNPDDRPSSYRELREALAQFTTRRPANLPTPRNEE